MHSDVEKPTQSCKLKPANLSMKLLFNDQSDKYKKYRPGYPQALIKNLVERIPERKLAWDAGCGNGQLALLLKPHFEQVVGSDPSVSQLAEAPKIEGIDWRLEPAEVSSLETQSCDLVSIAQALHWVNHEAFFAEVNRVLKPGGHFLALGYGLNRIGTCENSIADDAALSLLLNEIMSNFYYNIVGPFWEPERAIIDKRYETLNFPFEAQKFEPGEMIIEWNLNDYLGYLGTWSAVKSYQKEVGENPIEDLAGQLSSLWQANQTRKIHFPLFGYLGQK